MASSHSYWIPSNRNVKKCLGSYIQEVNYWYQLTGEVIPVIVLDSGNPKIESENATYIHHLAREYPSLNIHHVNFERQEHYVTLLLQKSDCPPSLINFFTPRAVNYGAVMNKISLFAAAIGSTTIHRRDSDTTLQPHCPMPLEVEMLRIDRGPESNDKSTGVIVGSGYVGEWNMDLKPFIEQDATLFNTFWSCLGVDKSLHDQIFQKLSGDTDAYYQGDTIHHTDRDGVYLQDAGNVALSRIFEWFPNLPSDAMSSDYSVFRIARGLGFPMIFHARRVVHEHHADRGEHVDAYLRTLVKYCDLRPIYSSLENTIANWITEGSRKTIRQLQIDIAQTLSVAIDQNKEERKQRIEEFLKCFVAARYPDWAARHLLIADDILEECCQDYRNHIELLNYWSTLMNTARALGDSGLFNQHILENA